MSTPTNPPHRGAPLPPDSLQHKVPSGAPLQSHGLEENVFLWRLRQFCIQRIALEKWEDVAWALSQLPAHETLQTLHLLEHFLLPKRLSPGKIAQVLAILKTRST